MDKMILKLCAVLLMLYYSNINSQNTTNTCEGEKYQQFDFWLGNWNVYDSNNKLIGTNLIQKMQNNCVLQENWESKTSPNTGTSYNFYNKSFDTWQQIWIDNSGFSLELKGNFTNGKMVLQSELQKSPNGNFYHRITWHKTTEGNVMQIWDYVDENGEVIKEAFRGIYKKNS